MWLSMTVSSHNNSGDNRGGITSCSRVHARQDHGDSSIVNAALYITSLRTKIEHDRSFKNH